MVEVSIRIFFQKNDAGLYPDYHPQLDMIEEKLKGKVKAYLDEADDMEIYQYYSIAPFGCLEARYLKRMGLGKSVMCIQEDIETYLREKNR